MSISKPPDALREPDEQEPSRTQPDARPYAEPTEPRDARAGLVDPSLGAVPELAIRVREEELLQAEYEVPPNRKLGLVLLIGSFYPWYFACLAGLGGGVMLSLVPLFAALWFTGLGLRGMFAKRTLRLDAQGLALQTKPALLGRGLRVAIDDLCEFRATSRRRIVDNAELWSLFAVLQDGRTVRVARDLGNRTEVESIVLRFNETLGRLRGRHAGYR